MSTSRKRFAHLDRAVVFMLFASLALMMIAGCGGPKRDMEKLYNKLEQKVSKADQTLRLLDDGMMEAGPANEKLDVLAFEIDSLSAKFNEVAERAYGRIPEEEIETLKAKKGDLMARSPL